MFPLNIEGEKLSYGDIGRVGDGPNLSGRTYTFQIGKGNTATSAASGGPPSPYSASLDAVDKIAPYLPTIIITAAVALVAWLLLGGKKKGGN